jgi:hypothetical protein
MLIYIKKRNVEFYIIKILLNLAFFYYKVVYRIIKYTKHVNLGEGNNNFFFRGKNREIIEIKRVLNNIFNIVDHELYFYKIKIIFISQGIRRTKTYTTIYY